MCSVPIGKTDGRLCDALFCQLLVVELGVCRTGRVDDQRFDIGYIGQQGEYLQVVDKSGALPYVHLGFQT